MSPSETRAKTILFVMAASTVSLTTLALPAARVVAAALPAHSGRAFSPSSFREIARQSHDRLGDIAAEVACSYLKKFGNAQAATPPAKYDVELGWNGPKPPAGEPRPWL